MSLRSVLRGTGVALATPFERNSEIDFSSLGKLIEFVIDGGVEYIVTLGTTGETPTLDRSEKIEIANYTLEKVNGRVPVVIGIGGNNTNELLHDLETFPVEKCVAVLSASPYYNKPSQEGLFVHYKTLAEASSRPILLYNVPGRTGRNISAGTAIRLAKEVENVGGIKEASGDMIQCMEILRDKPEDFLVVSGDDNLVLPQIACGMEGVISVAANCFPKDFSEMTRQCLSGNFKAAKEINDKLIEGYELLFAENNPAGLKAFLAEEGLIKNELRLPLVRLSDALHTRVRAYLEKHQLVMQE